MSTEERIESLIKTIKKKHLVQLLVQAFCDDEDDIEFSLEEVIKITDAYKTVKNQDVINWKQIMPGIYE